MSEYRGAHVALDVFSLDAGESRLISAPATDEAALVLLEGSVEIDGEPARRDSVFTQPASAAYLPPGTTVAIDATSAAELALATTVGCALEATTEKLAMIRPDDIVVHERGRAGWQRAVHDVIADTVPAQRLLIGETFNAEGQWSSFPPHKHDGTNGEPALEEVYYYRFDKPGGFGFQGLYEADGTEQAVFLRHGSIVGIPRGYHPVCAAPGYRLYYLWALVGARRELAMFEDPAHRWLNAR